ncbi:hypothetical protein JNB_19163 [Janibacter sp. HTCC2649]|uniref:hypothetical protein n=1 Tax=Janibacter sp. HTCC2649 TaxID=313589 RepID=UPI0000670F5C|nr:hypothetical protein [Janibacter sp. HTCC2649]EAP97621.1 hypothetical protein JNB_19163 [Janibacter sp. HTCC2649]
MDPSIFDGETPGELELNRLVQQAQAAMAWRTSVNALRGRAQENGVNVQVSASGGVVGVTVSDAACAGGGDALAGNVLDAVLAAQKDLAGQLQASAIKAFGEDSPQARTVQQSTGTRFTRAAILTSDQDDQR